LSELFSVQLAVQSRTLIKIPLYQPYDVYLSPLTSDISSFYKPHFYDLLPSQESEGVDKGKDYNELKIINESLKTCTMKVREKIF
jgi:hypothetical protein